MNSISDASNIKVWWGSALFADLNGSLLLIEEFKGMDDLIVLASNMEKSNGMSKKRISEQNSLASQYPELLKEWDYKKNIDLSPQDVTSGSHKKAWWLCSIGHSYAEMQEVIFMNTFAETEALLKSAIISYKNGRVMPHRFLD